MRNPILLGLLLCMLAACKPEGQQDSPAPVEAEPVAPVVEEVAQPAPSFNAEFPLGLEPTFAYKIRSKGVEETPDGRLRKLVIEYKQGDVALIDKAIEAQLLAKNYRRYKTFDQDGATVGDYGNSGHRVTVTTSPANGKLQLADGSLGTVYFVWKE